MDPTDVQPEFITFDCDGPLTSFGIAPATIPLVQDRVAAVAAAAGRHRPGAPAGTAPARV